MKTVIDVDDAIELSNQLAAINRNRDLAKIEFNYDGRAIEVPASELEEFRLTGLSTMDFILSREWPENPAYSTD